MKFNRVSIQNKLVYSITTISIIAISVVGYIGYSYTKDAYIDKVMITEHNDINEITSNISETLSVMKQDANFIANFYAMQKLLDWQSVGVKDKIARWDAATKNTFKSMIDLKNFYYKLRIIDLNGKENINVFYDQKKQKAVVQSDDKLQKRDKERYFYNALDLNPGDIHTSQMELNSEFGKIVYPYVPIVHFSSTIYDKNGNQRGVAVINAYAKNLLDSILNKYKKQSFEKNRVVIDKQGYFLYHKDETKRWGEQLTHNENYKNYKPELFKEVILKESGVYEDNNELFSYKRVYPDNANRSEYWIVISEVSKDDVYAPLKEFEKLFYLAFILTVLLLVFGIKKYIAKILSPLNSITSQLKSLSQGEIELSDINYDSDDEIKDLIESSKKLVNNINNTIQQTKAVASGNFTKRLDSYSDKDALSNAINDMTNKLDEAANLTTQLSNGDISGEIIVQSSSDTLAVALNALHKYLKNITSVAESISLGDFDVEFDTASDADRLGIAINEMIQTLKRVVEQTNNIADGDYSQNITPRSKKDRLGFALKKMTTILDENSIQTENNNWLKDGLSQLSATLSGVEDLTKISNDTISNIVKHVEGSSGVFFIYDKDENELFLQSSYAFVDRETLSSRFKPGEGIVGQVALEHKPILLKNVKREDYKIESGIVNQEPLNTYTFPIIYEGSMVGVAEVASFETFTELDKEFMDKASRTASAFFYNATQNSQIKELLEESQRSFEELQVKSEELQQSNVQMEEQQQQLEVQARDLKNKNTILVNTKHELDIRADELEKSSKYKSEFLANMSHELRTPLNSIILLSKLLSEDDEGKLDEDDIKKASVIHKSGQDLLLLINDILDLSKIESGKMEVLNEDISSKELTSEMHDLFSELSNENGVEFIIDDNYKSYINSDRAKLSQIIKNLLSNAFKFTKDGSVTLGVNYNEENSLPLSISVKDTGIGIPEDKKLIVFDAFKQVDGSISRNYGGTGLGLSISKKFTELIGGELTIQSTEGSGSEFTINLPAKHSLENIHLDNETNSITSEETVNTQNDSKQFLEDVISSEDNEYMEDDDIIKGKNILITDDDSRNIFSLSAILQKHGANTFHALSGEDALKTLDDKKIDIVLMDIMMPEMDGYTAIEKIRENEEFKELPIIAVTAKAMKDDKQKCLDAGADDYIAKPIDQDALLLMIKAWVSK